MCSGHNDRSTLNSHMDKARFLHEATRRAASWTRSSTPGGNTSVVSNGCAQFEWQTCLVGFWRKPHFHAAGFFTKLLRTTKLTLQKKTNLADGESK